MYATAAEYLGLPRETEDVKIEPSIRMKWQVTHAHTSDPNIWGPAYWFSLHNAAAHYPLEANNIVKERMKNRILAIPYEIPCTACRPHASAFIESNKDKLDTIVSGRHPLGRFYVDFHNKVNQRYNKRLWSYEEVYKMYSGIAQVKTLNIQP